MASKLRVSLMVGMILMVGLVSAAPKYEELFADYCSDNLVLDPNMDPNYLQSSRNELAGLSFSVSSITNAINGKGAGDIVKDVGGPIIVMIILAIIMIIMFFVYLCFCCCCDRANSDNTACTKACTVLAIIFFITFVALFITMIVYIGMMNNRVKRSACGISRIPYDLVKGGKAPDLNFVGLRNITYMIGNFSSQITNMALATPSFLTITGRGLPTLTALALQSSKMFYDKYFNSTTDDGAGGKARPLTVLGLNDGVNSEIKLEFNSYDTVARQLQTAALVGTAITLTTANAASYKKAMDDANVSLNDIINQINGTPGDVVSGFAQAIIYAPIGYWITLAFGILIIIFMLLMIIWVSRMYSVPTEDCRYCTKFFLGLTSFLMMLLALICIALLIASAAVTSICKAVPPVLNTNSLQMNNLLRGWGVNASSGILNVINNCVTPDATGNVSLVINSTDIGTAAGLNFLDGVLGFKNIRNNLTTESTRSPAISNTTAYWGKVQVSIIADHLTAIKSLETLNSQASCGGQSYQLNAQNCTSGARCQGIYDTTVSSLPSCAAASAQNAWNNLKLYTTSEFALLTNMIQDLNTTISSPNAVQANYRTAMISSFPDFQVILNSVGGFTNSVASPVGGFFHNTNCTIIRRELFNLEASICFTYANPLYYFTALLAFIVFFFFLFSIMICCALRCLPTRPEAANGQGQIYDNEIIPTLGDPVYPPQVKADTEDAQRANM